MHPDTMKYLLKLIHEECGGDKAVVDSIWSEIQSEVDEEVEEEEVEEVEEVEEEELETHLDEVDEESQQSPQQVISKFTRDFIQSNGWTHKAELDDWCISQGSRWRNPLYEKVKEACPVQWVACDRLKTDANYSCSIVRYAYQPLLQGYAFYQP